MPIVEVWLDDEEVEKMTVIKKELIKQFAAIPGYSASFAQMELPELASYLLKREILRSYPQPLKKDENVNIIS